MKICVIYDITKNKSRIKIVKLCKNYGLRRMQKSVFLGELTRNKTEMLGIEAKKYINPKTDKFFIVTLSKQNYERRIVLGDFNQKQFTKQPLIYFC